MLVLKRKYNSTEGAATTIITLPDGTQARVVVVEVRGDSVMLGFEFPTNVMISRADAPREQP